MLAPEATEMQELSGGVVGGTDGGKNNKKSCKRGRRIEVLLKPTPGKDSDEMGPADVVLKIHSPGNVIRKKNPTRKNSGINKHNNEQHVTSLLSPNNTSHLPNDIRPGEGETLEKTNEEPTLLEEKAIIWLSRRKKFVSLCKKFFAFLLSTLGLFILLVSYTILGGFIFNKIESPQESRTKIGVRKSLEQHVEKLWNVTKQLNVLHKNNWTIVASEIVDNYTRVVFLATKNDGWNGKDEGEGEPQWSFAGSLLYSVTVITTIGYGHIAPRTAFGRLVTILYATFGIPLTLLAITHVGGFMATVFRFLYKNIFCGLCCIYCRRIKEIEDAEDYEEINNAVPMKSRKRICCSCRRKSYGKKVLSPTKEALINPKADEPEDETNQSRLLSSYHKIVNWRRGIHNALFTEDNKNVQVPIYVSLLLIGIYVLLGALMFMYLEQDWDFLVGCYFCFITLSTIGFGDFVPGTSLDHTSSQSKLVLCTLYLIIGLALLAMCFDLMQEEARCLFRSLGRKLGLVPNEASNTEAQDRFKSHDRFSINEPIDSV